jgi:hypothetical protein
MLQVHTPPGAPPAQDEGAGTVTVLVAPGAVDPALLRERLPVSWDCRALAREEPVADLLVLAGPGLVGSLSRARSRWPRAGVLAVVEAQTGAEEIVSALTAGADGCVRAATPAVVAAHLAALHRRQILLAHAR